MTAAFYRGGGTWIDALIRWRTSSVYSHCELVVGGLAYSASVRDGGVRRKEIVFSPDRWDLIKLPNVAATQVLGLWRTTEGDGYDWLGVVVGQTFAVRANRRRRWWCSEWCAAALGFHEPWRYSPGGLADAVSAVAAR